MESPPFTQEPSDLTPLDTVFVGEWPNRRNVISVRSRVDHPQLNQPQHCFPFRVLNRGLLRALSHAGKRDLKRYFGFAC